MKSERANMMATSSKQKVKINVVVLGVFGILLLVIGLIGIF